jgi:hypothetical protein
MLKLRLAMQAMMWDGHSIIHCRSAAGVPEIYLEMGGLVGEQRQGNALNAVGNGRLCFGVLKNPSGHTTIYF